MGDAPLSTQAVRRIIKRSAPPPPTWRAISQATASESGPLNPWPARERPWWKCRPPDAGSPRPCPATTRGGSLPPGEPSPGCGTGSKPHREKNIHISSPDDAARWARRRDQEELARKVRVRVFWWIAAAIVFTAFILAATVLLAQDNPEAVRWYRLAADQGFAGAQSLLGSMYALGWGVRRDLGLAYMWLNIASANGEEAARERPRQPRR